MQLDKEEIQELIDLKLKDGVKKYGKDFKFAVLEIISLERMLNPTQTAEVKSKIIPLSEWDQHHSYPTVGALRQLYFKRKENGFDYCVEYGGSNSGRILINENKYFEWNENRDKFKIK